MKTWKIYKHTLLLDCPSKGKSYVGQTSEPNVELRWSNGWGYYTRRQNKNNTIFYNAIKKYGWENFSHELIEENIKTLDEANEREKYWIAYYHTFIEDPKCWGYNMTAGGSGVPHKQSEETKKKISKALTGRQMTEDHKAKINKTLKRKQIICIETKVIYESISEAARQTGISRENIKTALNGKRLSAGGYHWALVDDQEKISELSALAGKYKAAKRSVICIETGFVFESISEAARRVNVGQSGISNVLSGKCKTAGGYHWKYLE